MLVSNDLPVQVQVPDKIKVHLVLKQSSPRVRAVAAQQDEVIIGTEGVQLQAPGRVYLQPRRTGRSQT
ncbi:MAG: hypothetical protein EBY17_14905 [Acidobacteriia bacterium]|nr:hypothetical protein [Terriglobia bacterium]